MCNQNSRKAIFKGGKQADPRGPFAPQRHSWRCAARVTESQGERQFERMEKKEKDQAGAHASLHGAEGCGWNTAALSTPIDFILYNIL